MRRVRPPNDSLLNSNCEFLLLSGMFHAGALRRDKDRRVVKQILRQACCSCNGAASTLIRRGARLPGNASGLFRRTPLRRRLAGGTRGRHVCGCGAGISLAGGSGGVCGRTRTRRRRWIPRSRLLCLRGRIPLSGAFHLGRGSRRQAKRRQCQQSRCKTFHDSLPGLLPG
jgi:hypothetical protein